MKYSTKDIFLTFFKLGCVSFGGYMSLISVVHKRFVEKDETVPNQLLADMVALAALLPGPVAVNVVSAVGYYLKGVRGAFVAFFGIILPAFLLMATLYYFYSSFSDFDLFVSFFTGAAFVIIAIIISVGFNMLKKEKRDSFLILVVPLSFIILLFFHSFWHLLILFMIAGIVGWFLNHRKYTSDRVEGIRWWLILLPFILFGFIYLIPRESIYLDLAGTFATVSVTLFGGGYVMVPLLNEIVVLDKQWLTQSEFINSITLGQITPGPILISAAFVGFKQAGFVGGIIATLAIFMPSAIIMVCVFYNLKAWLSNRNVRAFFDGLRMAVIGMIFYSGVALFLGQQLSWMAVLTLVSFFMLIFLKINPILLIVGGGVLGVLIHLF